MKLSPKTGLFCAVKKIRSTHGQSCIRPSRQIGCNIRLRLKKNLPWGFYRILWYIIHKVSAEFFSMFSIKNFLDIRCKKIREYYLNHMLLKIFPYCDLHPLQKLVLVGVKSLTWTKRISKKYSWKSSKFRRFPE